jgi:hypothetical protein
VITTPVFLLICLVYARMHKGSDWFGILLGLGFGVSLGAGPVRDAVLAINEGAAAVGMEILNAIGQRLGGGAKTGPAPANGLVALRYNVGLLGIGR